MQKALFLSAVSLVTLMAATATAQSSNSGQKADTLTASTRDIDAFGGNIDAFYGDIEAFIGNIDAFGGNIDAFGGNIDAFWGTIDAFGGNIDAFGGNIDAFWGDIEAFWGDVEKQWRNIDAFIGDIDAFGGNIDAFGGDGEKAEDLTKFLKSLFSSASDQFGDAYEKNTGVSFNQGFRDALLAKYGVDINDASSFLKLTKNQRNQFFLEFYDGLMMHSGADMVDHWMSEINWSPKISQDANYGKGVKIGLLDTPITDKDIIGGKIRKTGGYGLSSVDHGAGVAGLIAGAHDGVGVMGVAPKVNFTVYNPFDETFTASWDDVGTGVTKLARNGANIINMSLGVNGYTLHKDWAWATNKFFGSNGTNNIVFVKSAGNSGTTQTENVSWGYGDAFNRFLIVGSVGPTGEISKFSNRPGEACLTLLGKCWDESHKIKYRFLVAPGENILVQNNDGSITRASGTSLAAPLVSGAVALAQSRWPWLKSNPKASAQLILQTADDLGEPGVDAVYGWGRLNVAASQSPINPEALYTIVRKKRVYIGESGLSPALVGLSPKDKTISLREDFEDTFRDFDVKLANLTLGNSSPEANKLNSTNAYLATQISGLDVTAEKKKAKNKKRKKRKNRKKNKKRKNKLYDASMPSRTAFDTMNGYEVDIAGGANARWSIAMAAHPRNPDIAFADDALGYTTGVTIENRKTGFRMMAGSGNNVLSLTGDTAFGRPTDHSMETGGVNPFLSFASGGSYLAAALPLNQRIGITFGISENEGQELYRDSASGALLPRHANVSAYAADASTVAMTFAASESTTIGTRVTMLREANGLYGAQGTGLFSLDAGTQTSAVTFDARKVLTPTLNLAASATVARTLGGQSTSALKLSDGGLMSTAYEVALEGVGLLNSDDLWRVSLAQPLHVHDGSLNLQTTSVIDRETGELGLVTNQISLGESGPRHVAEMLYATPVLRNRADLALFGQYQTRNLLSGEETPEITAGIKLSVDY